MSLHTIMEKTTKMNHRQKQVTISIIQTPKWNEKKYSFQKF